MKKLVLLAAAIAVYFAFSSIGKNVVNPAKPSPTPALPPVDDLAHKLQDAWASHHTVA